MKKFTVLISVTILMLLRSAAAFAGGGDTFYVSGNHIYDPCGSRFTPRGINYSVLDDWSFPANLVTGGEMSSQIIQANPNAVRISWWRNYNGGGSGRPAYSLTDLDSVISRFERAGIVSIVFLPDVTGNADSALLMDSTVSWWTSPPVVALVNKHKHSMIVNIAGEWGYVEYATDPATALVSWQNTYKTAINAIRSAGITVPLLIDGPDYANFSDAYAPSGPMFTAADPLHNIILSVHAYWAISSSCASYDTATIRSELLQMDTLSFPVIIGETSNTSPSCDGTVQCAYAININAILTDCQSYDMGWLCWEWYDDVCAPRQVSSTGMFTALSPFGDTVVHNTTYGLATTAIKTGYMANGETCSTGMQNEAAVTLKPVQVLTDADRRQVLAVYEDGDVSITDVYGRVVWHNSLRQGAQLNLSSLNLRQGIYAITHFSSQAGRYALKTFLY